MSKKYTQLIIDEDGVIVSQHDIYNSPTVGVTRGNVDMALSKEELDSEDIKLLYAYLKTTRNINEYSQIKVNGRWIDHDVMNVILNDMTVFGYVHKIISLAHPYSMIVKKTREKNIVTWNELFLSVACKDRKMQARVKSALIKNKLIAELKTEFKGTQEKVFIINPFIYRKSAFVSQIALHAFRKDIDGYVDGYVLIWLKAIGIV